VHTVVPDAPRGATRFLSRKRREVNVRQDESRARGLLVETGALFLAQAGAASFFIPGKYQEPSEERGRNEDEDEIRHGG
jgi:hypothetical protein